MHVSPTELRSPGREGHVLFVFEKWDEEGDQIPSPVRSFAWLKCLVKLALAYGSEVWGVASFLLEPSRDARYERSKPLTRHCGPSFLPWVCLFRSQRWELWPSGLHGPAEVRAESSILFFTWDQAGMPPKESSERNQEKLKTSKQTNRLAHKHIEVQKWTECIYLILICLPCLRVHNSKSYLLDTVIFA